MDDFEEIYIDEDDPQGDQILNTHIYIKWLGVADDQTTVIIYDDISWVKRKLLSWILGVIWKQPRKEN